MSLGRNVAPDWLPLRNGSPPQQRATIRHPVTRSRSRSPSHRHSTPLSNSAVNEVMERPVAVQPTQPQSPQMQLRSRRCREVPQIPDQHNSSGQCAGGPIDAASRSSRAIDRRSIT